MGLTDITFHFFFNDQLGVGVASLTPTVNIYRIPRAGGAGTLEVNAAAATETVGVGSGGGFYQYRYAGADLGTYNYTAKAVTASTSVQAKEVPALWCDFSSHVTGLWTVLFSGITSLANWMRGLARKDVMDVTAKAELNSGGGAYNETTDSLEANRDNIGATGSNLTSLAAASIFAGITSLANWLRGIYRKDAMNAAAKLEVNAGGGTYDETTDSNQAIADGAGILPPATIDLIWDELIAGHLNAGSTGEALAYNYAKGSIEFTYTLLTPGLVPISSASVWITTDIAGTNVIWRGETDTFGVARDVLNNKPWLDAGIYFFWCQHDNYSFTNPDSEIVS